MAGTEGGVKLSKTSPAFLHANSTSHTWIFSAVAELIDNAYDSQCKTLWIDKKVIHETDALVFMDDGKGMSPQELHHMLSFGYCDKQNSSFRPVGQYGNGFKSGSMRLGIDAIVFTKDSHNLSVGFLSQSYLREINADTILVPIISWDAETEKLVQAPDLKGSMHAITTYSIFSSPEELTSEFGSMSVAKTGTRIIIYNLKRGQSNRYELDFESNPADIINSESTMVDEYILRNELSIIPAFRRSLREYCSILFLRPRMKIVLRGCKVKTKLIAKSLSKTEKDVYNPRWLNSRPVKITFGFTSQKQDYGILMYSKNRLIKAYEKVGFQKQPNSLGVGVVGVIQTDFLEPIHNKQDFNKTDHYNTLRAALGVKLNEYWHAKMGTDNDRPQNIGSARPDWNWVQCDNCLKWRRLADTQSLEELPEKWFCHLNTDLIHNRCDVPEEPEDEDELIMRATYPKISKSQKKNRKQQQIKIKEKELSQKEEYLQQVEQQLREKESQVPDLQKDLEEAIRREKEQIQCIRILEQREKQILDCQQKLQEDMANLNDSPAPGPSGTKREGSIESEIALPKKKSKVVSEGEDFVITNKSDEEEKDIVNDEDGNDDPPPTTQPRRDSADVKPDVNELNKQIEVQKANSPAAAAEADLVPSTSTEDPSAAEASTSNVDGKDEEKEEPMDQSDTVGKNDKDQQSSEFEEKAEPETAQAANKNKNNTEPSSSKETSTKDSATTKTFKDQEVQVEVKTEVPDPCDAQEFKNCQAKLKDTEQRLKSLRENVFELLKMIVPDLKIDNLELIEGVVTEMIKVNAEKSVGSGFVSPIKPCMTNGLRVGSENDESNKSTKSSKKPKNGRKSPKESNSSRCENEKEPITEKQVGPKPEEYESQDIFSQSFMGYEDDVVLCDSTKSKENLPYIEIIDDD